MVRKKKKHRRLDATSHQPVVETFYIDGQVEDITPDSIRNLLTDYLSIPPEKSYVTSSGIDDAYYEKYPFGEVRVYKPWFDRRNYKIRVKLNSASLVPEDRSLDEFSRLVIAHFEKQKE